MAKIKPTLGVDCDLAKLKFPLYASQKIDGIRALSVGGRLVSRSLKLIRNDHIQNFYSWMCFDNIDGELVVGPPNAKDTYTRSNSGVMSKEGKPDFKWYVFDIIHEGTYSTRLSMLSRFFSDEILERIEFVEQTLIHSMEELLVFEEGVLNNGYEGVMLRQPNSPYKYGRSTVNQGYLLKLKRWEDSEAIIEGYQELRRNDNVLTKDNLGHAKRSSHKENKTPMGTLGSLHVRDCKTGVDFKLGTGYTKAMRKELWEMGEDLIGKMVKYKHFPIGVKDKPRFPGFLGFRDEDDMS